MELQRGTLLQGGKYRIEQTLGRGGFGVTYLATHMALGGSVCIKEFFPQELCQRAADGSAMATISERSAETIAKFKTKFLDEARKLFYIKHPNIVGVSDLFEENSTAYYVMEYIDGESLKSRIDRCGALSESDARRYVGQVAAALRDIHRNGMLHLDIKPANIMLRAKDDTAVVIDFGLAKHYDPKTGEQTTTYVAAHSPGYAPLEQSTSGIETFSPAADIYSLGATLYAMVTGVQPPKASVIMNEGLPELPSALSPSLRNAIKRSTELVIKRRPQNIDAFMDIIGTVDVAGDNRGGAKPDKPKTSIPKKRSNWWLWLFLLLIVVGGFVGYMMSGGDEPEPIPTISTTSPPINIGGHYAVDLGLSVKWATCNVGATSPEGYGDYFAWGETSPKTSYTEDNSKTYGKSMGDIGGDSRYDAATANWGSGWRLPTKSECYELIDNCTWTWTKLNGVDGYKVKSKKNGNSIFLPAAGYYYRGTNPRHVPSGYYWSSTPDGSCNAYHLYFISIGHGTDWYYRYLGRSVRPVAE